jgi:serine/threonine-protein kinase
MNVGVIYFNIGQFEMASTYFQRGIELAPANADLYSNAGTVSFFLGRFQEDVQYCQKAIALSPKKYDYWGNLADAYRMIPTESNNAAMAYRQAISLANDQLKVNPNDTDVMSSLALYHSRIGEAKTAREYLSKVLQVRPNDSDILRIASLIHLDAGERQESLKWLEKSVRAGYPRGQLVANPELAALRSEPGFTRLAKIANSFD